MSEASIRAAKAKEHASKEYKAMRAKKKAELAAARSARIEAKLRRDLERTMKSIAEMRKPKTALQKKRSTQAGTLRELIARRDAVKEQLKKIAGKQGGNVGKSRMVKGEGSATGNPIAPDRGKGIDDAGPAGEEARRDKTKKKKPQPPTADKRSKKKTRTGISKGSMMGGRDGPSGPVGGPLDKDKRKKKKKTMLGSNAYGAGKGRYGDIKPGVYKGQR